MSDISQKAASPGISEAQSDLGRMFKVVGAERATISEVVETTKELIAGEGGAAEMS